MNDVLFQVYTATGEQELKEAATIAVHIEPVCFSLKVNLLDCFSKATLNDSERIVLKYQRSSTTSQWL